MNCLSYRGNWSLRLESNQLPPAYRAGAHPHELRSGSWSVWKESNLLVRAPKARGQPMTHTQNEWTPRLELNQRRSGLQPLASPLGHEVMIGVIGWTLTTYSRVTACELGYFAFDHTGGPVESRTRKTFVQGESAAAAQARSGASSRQRSENLPVKSRLLCQLS